MWVEDEFHFLISCPALNYCREELFNNICSIGLSFLDVSNFKKYKENFEDTKRVIRIHNLEDRQHNGQKKKNKKDNQRSTKHYIKLKIGYY